MTFNNICDKLLKAKNIAIFTHINSDCDGVGSMFGLCRGLTSLGKNCRMFVDGKLNKFESQIFEMSLVNAEEFDVKIFDTLVAVDAASSARLGKYREPFMAFENTVLIDHHICREKYAKLSYSEEESASCSEIIFELLTKLGVKIDEKIATYLYAGIATDTNSFVNSNTTARSYQIAGKLFDFGADTVKINALCFRAVSRESINLMKLFYKKIKIVNNTFAYVILNKKDFDKTKTSHLDTSAFSNMLLSIEGMQAGCCITQRGDVFSMSLRSKVGVDVNEFARLFGGGGHLQASGATLKESQKEIEKKLVARAKEYFKEEK